MNTTKEAYNTNVATFLKKLQVIGYDWLIDHIYIQDIGTKDINKTFGFLVDIHIKTPEQLDMLVHKLFENICEYRVDYCYETYTSDNMEEENKIDSEIVVYNKLGFDIFIIVNGPLANDTNIPARILLET